ncbi:MAG: CvpA family protein [Oscillospiraceae bacterium]
MGFFDNIKAKFDEKSKQPQSSKPIEVFEPKGKFKKTLINMLVTAVVGLVYFYIELPAINLKSREFYFFFFILAGVYCVTAIITSGIWKLRGQDEFFTSVRDHCKIPLAVCALFLVIIVVGTFLSGVIIRARSYRDLLTVEMGDFTEDVKEISFDQIPMLDRDSAERLGDRKLGELSDMVSQFEVADDYSQVNYQQRPVRVTPLEYGDLIKWINNRSKGLPAYILVDMVTQKAEVVRLEEGMKYTTTEHFSRNLSRHIRFRYPTMMFATPTFEINDDGTPFWVCPRLIKRIGLFGGDDILGAVLVNAITGESEYYETVPQWVDRVYSADLIIQQYDYHGLFINGWLNSVLGQKGVTVTTAGYNYIAMNDDVYMYTGITSVGTDQSNTGFILSNQRTKETKQYHISGATEYSAMASAEGVVQHLGYKATFPLLLNIGSEPTYFLSLKDNAGLVKMYAMVNVAQYQIVATGTSVEECEDTYIKLLRTNNLDSGQLEVDAKNDLMGVVEDMRSAVLSGNTFFYIKLENDENYYSINVSSSPQAAILSVGDTIKLGMGTPKPVNGIIEANSLLIVSRAAGTAPPQQTATEVPKPEEAAPAQNAPPTASPESTAGEVAAA